MDSAADSAADSIGVESAADSGGPIGLWWTPAESSGGLYMGITFQDPLGPYHEKWDGYTPYMGIT